MFKEFLRFTDDITEVDDLTVLNEAGSAILDVSEF
jgi:hypothetical protein